MRRAAVAALLLFIACGKAEAPQSTTTTAAAEKPKPPAPPAAPAAQELIASSADFGDFHFTNAAFTYPENKPPAALVKGGFVKSDGTLTEKGKNDKRFLVRPNGFVDVVPLAKKTMLRATAVRPQPDGNVLVDFDWKWEPNELGQLLATPKSDPQKGTAKLMWDGSQWMILSIND